MSLTYKELSGSHIGKVLVFNGRDRTLGSEWLVSGTVVEIHHDFGGGTPTTKVVVVAGGNLNTVEFTEDADASIRTLDE
jgi:hypothetical protein